MKRKIAVVLVLVLVLAFTVGMLTGCDEIFKVNEERDANQIVATVNYEGQTAHVYKYELESSFNSYSYLYHAYYGMSYEQAADYILQSLAQRKLMVLFAKSEVAKHMGIETEAALVKVEELLSKSEIDRAVDNVNEDMVTALNAAIKDIIDEENYIHNSGNGGGSDKEYEEYEGEDAVKVYFKSNGGSEVSRQKIQKGTTAFEPDDPTREGYTFYGWYTDKAFTAKYDFTAAVNENITLYAKWEKYTAPRPVRDVPEEDKDVDYDPDDDTAEVSPRFFTEDNPNTLNPEFRALIDSGEVELDEEKYAEYIDKGVEDLAADMKASYMNYDYYLRSEMETLLLEKLERITGESASVVGGEIQARFDSMVAQNKEAFAGSSDTAYESALKSSLSSTFYHKYYKQGERYGFVLNILLKMPEEDVKVLTDMLADNVQDKKYVYDKRDELLRGMEVNVSNPDYDPDFECDKHEHDGSSSCDPMTCPNHACVSVDGAYTEGVYVENDYNKDNDYNNILSFAYNEETEEWEIAYNVHECPEMAYLQKTVPAFSKDGQTGIVEQIYASFGQVTEAVETGALTHVESVYWIRELATAWLYLVGDDEGGTNSESNNGGLGYLVTPAGKDSGYIDAFTDQARALINKGTGAYTTDGTVDGSYVFGDSFIESGKTDGAYAGIFILVATSVPYDPENAYTVVENGDGTFKEEKIDAGEFVNGVLPFDYIVTYGKTLEDCVTIEDMLEEQLLTKKQDNLYNDKANGFGAEYGNNVTYFKKAYKSLWKGLD